MSSAIRSFIIGIAVATLILLVLFPPSCESKRTKSDKSEIVKSLKDEKQKLKPIIEYQEKEVIKYRTRYQILKDTISVPSGCDTIVKTIFSACDSALSRDSALIHTLSLQSRIDSSIIANQDVIIAFKNDSLKLVNRKLKRARFFNKILVAGSLLLGGAALSR